MITETDYESMMRSIIPVTGEQHSDIEHDDERQAVQDAVEGGDVLRESWTGYDDFTRVIAYIAPGGDTRYALHFVQPDGVRYLLDSDDQATAVGAYEEQVRAIAEVATSPYSRTDIPGLTWPEAVADD